MENGKWKMENTRIGIFRSLSFPVHFQLAVIRRAFSIFYFPFSIFLCLFLSACGQLEKSKPEPFYAETAPPKVKEFRWSNGKLPKSFDPAKASAPPETDVVRAIYEGLTDTNAKTLETVPAIAVGWSASDDFRTWTFKLRRDARWSNGEHITAADFVRSWKRLAMLGEYAPHFQLLGNIAGMRSDIEVNPPKNQPGLEIFPQKNFNQDFSPIFKQSNNGAGSRQNAEPKSTAEPKLPAAETRAEAATEQKTKPAIKPKSKFGVEAPDDFTLKVSLVKSDKDFPALVAHPLFRPVFGDGKYFEGGKLSADIITSGAFRVTSASQSGVTLDRSETFWNKAAVELERVRFVPMENGEKALEAYRAGELDALTNVDFEPLALKLLTPFDDFQRTPHSALNFYEFNTVKPPFDDRRVRQAMAISIERERLTEDEMDGASIPALSFSLFDREKISKLKQDAERAKTLLADAGFPKGENFPTVRLVVNRNNMQQRIARSVAKMWKQNLNVETEIIVKEQAEIDAAKQAGDFNVLRRGVVLPTTDEAVNMLAIFPPKIKAAETVGQEKPTAEITNEIGKDNKNTDAENSIVNNPLSESGNNEANTSEDKTDESPAEAGNNENTTADHEILTEGEAIFQMPVIPLYFSTSYSLVKPYILGFEINTLDAPSLKEVRIDNDWQPKRAKSES